jgi:hypothetical protein
MGERKKSPALALARPKPVFEGYFEQMLAYYGGRCQPDWEKLTLEEKISFLKAQRRAQGIPESRGLPTQAYD